MKHYTITLSVTCPEPNPGTDNHWQALIKNPNNKFDIISIEEKDV